MHIIQQETYQIAHLDAHLVILELNDNICVAQQLNDWKSMCLFTVTLTGKRVERMEYGPFHSDWFYLNVVEDWLP